MGHRRQFLSGCVVLGVTPPAVAVGFSSQDDSPKALDRTLVNQFVAKSHGDVDTIKSMLKKEPALINCARDWGGGDWETGLGAASHVGRKEIAMLLLDGGARLDVFAAVMLGMTAVVSEMLKVRKKLHTIPGPHEIPMLTHAIFGREDANDVFELLLEAGADVNGKSRGLMTTPLMAAVSIQQIEQAEELLRRGADPTAKDGKGVSVLDIAKRRKDKNMTALITKAIANHAK